MIPKQFLEGIQEVEIRQQNVLLLIVPILNDDPILQLGSEPILDNVDDASINHDRYLMTKTIRQQKNIGNR